MSRWKDEFENHEIHRIVENVLALLDEKRDHLSADEQIELRRLKKVMAAFVEALSKLDGELISIDSLNQIQSNFDSVVNCMKRYVNRDSIQYLIEANNYLSGILPQISQLIIFAKKVPALRSVREFEENLDNLYTQFDGNRTDLDQDLSKISIAIETQNNRLSELSDEIASKKQETDGIISSWQENFLNAQSSRNNEFIQNNKEREEIYDAWNKRVYNEIKQDVANLLNKSENILENHQNKFDKEISNYLKSANDKHTKILELYELVAGDSVASSYLKNAEDEQKQANVWRRVAIGFIVCTALWAGVSYWFGGTVILDGSILWGELLKSFHVVGILLFGAGYSAKQSNVHRQNEKRTRWFALEVKAFDPFIASLNEEDQKALKIKLSEKIFGQHEIKSDGKNINHIEHACDVIAKKVANMLN